jgi:hypothetical protein
MGDVPDWSGSGHRRPRAGWVEWSEIIASIAKADDGFRWRSTHPTNFAGFALRPCSENRDRARKYRESQPDIAAWRKLWRPYWCAKRRLPAWLPLTPSWRLVEALG